MRASPQPLPQIAMGGMLKLRHIWFLSQCPQDKQEEFHEGKTKTSNARVIMNCPRAVISLWGACWKWQCCIFLPHGVRGCVFLGKKSAWDAGGLAARNTHDGNFSDLGIMKERWRSAGGDSICMPSKENVLRQLPDSSAEVSGLRLWFWRRLL